MTKEPVIHCSRIPLSRVGTLVDAIYAFAMTLLVLSIDIPSKFENSGVAAPVNAIIVTVIPDLLHYFVAFVLLAILWYFEHQRFLHLKYLDRPLLCMNIASLAFVCLIPFTTDVAGDYPFDTLGAALFELNIFIVGSIACIQWLYIRRTSRELVPDLNAAYIRREIRWSLVFPLLSIAGIVLAMLQLVGSVAVYVLAPIIMALLFWRELT